MSEPTDRVPVELLAHLGVDPGALLGEGGEARVYALDDTRVVRVLRPPTETAALVDPPGSARTRITAIASLLDELRSPSVPFELPRIRSIERFEIDGGAIDYVIEERLPGVAVGQALAAMTGRQRADLITAHLEAAAALGTLPLQPRPWFGDLVGDTGVREPTWRAYLQTRARRSLADTPGLEDVDVDAVATGLADDLTSPLTGPPPESGAFVHLDCFVGNMLAVGSAITAVIDIGLSTVVGDGRLNALTAVVYLCAPPITPQATADDRLLARRWLADRGLDEAYEPTKRWLAAYWAWAVDDAELHGWCQDVLLDEISSTAPRGRGDPGRHR